jgi:hypothetical protein
LFPDAPDHLMTRFVDASSGYLEAVGIAPNLLRFDEVDSVFCLVRSRLAWIELKLQRAVQYTNYTTLGPVLEAGSGNDGRRIKAPARKLAPLHVGTERQAAQLNVICRVP